MMAWTHDIILGINWLVLGYFLALNSVYTVLLLLSALELQAYFRSLRYGSYDLLFSDPRTPPVSVLMPAYNEAVNIGTSVRGVLGMRYPSFEVIVINDGSTDGMLEVLRREFQLVQSERLLEERIKTQPVRVSYRSLTYDNLIVLDKVNGGKADALNAGINAARTPYICSVDADVVMEEDALLRVVRPVLESPVKIAAVGGIVRVANGCRIEGARVLEPGLPRTAVPMFQVAEYLRAFLGGRTGLSAINGLLIISGAFGLFDRRLAIEAGGYRTDTVGEDMELVVSLHALMREKGQDYRIRFIGDPVCWTEVPATLEVLSRQRRRWQRGLLEALSFHRKMLFNSRYGVLGFFSYPFFLFFEGWGPVIEFLGYASVLLTWLFGWLDAPFAVLFLTVALLFGMFVTLGSVLLDEFSYRKYPRWTDIARLLVYAVFENLGYRQVTTVFRCWGVWDHLSKKEGWGEMDRKGLGT